MKSIISSIITQNKFKDFTSVFTVFRPFLFDMLKRREEFKGFLKTLKFVCAKEKVACQDLIKNLEVKDIIILLLESCSDKSMAKLGPWLTNLFYPLPIFYPIGKNKFRLNLDCCLELMFQTGKLLITSIGTQNSAKKGKSSLLSYLFSTPHPINFSTGKGFTHNGSIDLYPKLRQESFTKIESESQELVQYILADVNGYTNEPDFQDITSRLWLFSQLVLVHLTLDDVLKDPETEEIHDMEMVLDDIFPMNRHGSNFVLLLRDYDDEELESDIANKVNESLSTNSRYLAVIGVPRLDDGQDNQGAKDEVLEQIKEILANIKGSGGSPISNLKKSYKNFGQDIHDKSIKSDIDEDSVTVRNILEMKSQESKQLYKSLFPCFWNDFLLNQEIVKKKKMDINHAEMMEVQIPELAKRYDETIKIIKSFEINKTKIRPSDLIQHVCNILSSNDLAKIIFLSETINQWKMPLVEPLKKKYLKLSGDKKTVKESQRKYLEQEMKKLEEEIDDKDISLDTFLDEIHTLYECGKVNEVQINGIRRYISSIMKQGSPINLVNGKTLKFGNKLLKELFAEFADEDKKVYVVSIIGAQSSAKSTLLNALFGCGFATSSGRCTKGLYVSLMQHPDGSYLLVIDTEGLLSVVARDHEFDNLITTMAFSCSHVVIINNKGEINAQLRDLLEICVYAMKHLRLTHIKPKIVFALRDIIDDNSEMQQEMLAHMMNSLDEAGRKFQIDINNFIDISEENVFLFPSAFHSTVGENGLKVQSNNTLFSQKVLDARNYIFKYLESMDPSSCSIPNLMHFYIQTEQLWGDVTEHGSIIMRARNLLEIELKQDAFDQVNLIFQRHNEILLSKGRLLLETQKNELKRENENFQDSFSHLLSIEFNAVRNNALAELERDVLENEKYAVISGCHREFIESLEYFLGWQKQNFLSEWRAFLLSYEPIKEMNKFKADLKLKVDDILHNRRDTCEATETLLILFKLIKQKSKTDYTEKLKILQQANIEKLAPEIQGHFERTQQRRSRKEKELIMIPTVGDLLQRMGSTNFFATEKRRWVRLHLVEGSVENSGRLISGEFLHLQHDLESIITEVSTEETATHIITMCVERTKKIERNGLPVNPPAFLRSCLVEAMMMQYIKAGNAEIDRIKKVQLELESVLEEEEKHITQLLEQSKDSYQLGMTTADKCYKELLKAFCEEQEIKMQNVVMKKVRAEFPAPESANLKAYENSFGVSNYENVVKYVLNINMFIRELYDERIRLIAKFEITKSLDNIRNDFIRVVQETIVMTKKWSINNQSEKAIDLSTLIGYAKENAILKNYFPDLYTVQVFEINIFTRGFIKTLGANLEQFDTSRDINETILKKVEEYLRTQYQILTGCQARCPICHNKCIRTEPDHKDHHTNCHLLSGFSGIRDFFTAKVTLKRCFDTSNYKSKWYDKTIFENFDEFINVKHPDWRKEFPTKEQTKKHETVIPLKFIECWVAVKDVLIRRYKLVDNTPLEWESQVPKEKRLRADLIIPGYTDVSPKS